MLLDTSKDYPRGSLWIQERGTFWSCAHCSPWHLSHHPLHQGVPGASSQLKKLHTDCQCHRKAPHFPGQL